MRISGNVCAVCGERLTVHAFSGNQEETICELCRRLAPTYAKAVAYGSYEGGLRELIHLLKYDRVRPAAAVLGRMLAEAVAGLQPLFDDGPITVAAVPLHRARLRERGFNQAELIARSALKLIPEAGRFQLLPGALQRKRETQSQIGLSRHQRRENLRGAFAVAKPHEIRGQQVLLIDDVFTTGTTVSECARELRRAGAAKVYVATVARTLKLEAHPARFEVEGMSMAAAS